MADELVDALLGTPPKDSRTRCYYKTWLAQQTPELQEAVIKAMDNKKWKTTAIYALLKSRGYEAQYNTLRMHRAETCSC